jgi:hypothetical protein
MNKQTSPSPKGPQGYASMLSRAIYLKEGIFKALNIENLEKSGKNKSTKIFKMSLFLPSAPKDLTM